MKKRTDILFLLPSLAGFLTFFIVPFFYSFTYAFTENAFTKKFVWFDNFTALFRNDFFRLAMKNTGKFTLCAVPLTMVLSILFFGERPGPVQLAGFVLAVAGLIRLVQGIAHRDPHAHVPVFKKQLLRKPP